MDEDDFSIVVHSNPSTTITAASTQPTSTTAIPKAQITYVENFAFDRAMYSLEGAGDRNSKPSSLPRKPTLEVVGRSEDGPWEPVPKEQVNIPLVSAKKKASNKEEEDKPVKKLQEAPQQHSKQKEFKTTVSTTYLGKNKVDYQNRRFCDVRRMPQPIPFIDDESSDDEDIVEPINPDAAKMMGIRKKGRQAKKKESIPNKMLREYGPCAMGLHRVRIWGGLALTAGLDGACLIWDASKPGDVMGATQSELANELGAIQSYVGHGGQAVKDCWFASDGTKFASAGFDGCVVLWDTDTGKELNRFRGTSGSMNAVRFRPGEDFSLLAACGDRKLRHWDLRQSVDKPTQIYDYHQSSNVNACSFCDMGRRFISTGDDKKLLVWDFAVPAPIKIVSETWLPGMPALATHPSTYVVCALGMDSRLAQFRISRRTGKVQRTHDVTADGFKAAGFACEPCFSPDGEFLACGDGDQGGVWIWRVKPAGFVKRIEGAHATGSPVASVMWHPCFEGVLITCGWDGKMKWFGM